MSQHADRRLALGVILAAFAGPTLPGWTSRLLGQGLSGVVLFGRNITDRGQLAALVSDIKVAGPHAIVGVDEEGGDVTRIAHREGSPYPGNAALGAVDDMELTYRVYESLGRDLAELGINLDLAPTVDVNSADENPVIGPRSFGAQPGLVARHAAAAVTGLQAAGVAACAKHFPGHGATSADSHLDLPTVDASRSLLRSRDLPPFVAAINTGVRAVMTAHIRVPAVTGDLPATMSSVALRDLLRGELGFPGVIMTDALEMRGASEAIGVPEAAVRSLAAGADLLCLGADITEEIVESVVAAIEGALAAGRLDRAELSASIARVAKLVPPRVKVPHPRLEGGTALGLAAARRAIAVSGSLPELTAPLLIELDSPSTIAVGDVPWGLAPYLGSSTGGAEVLRVRAGEPARTETNGRFGSAGTDPETLVAKAGDRDIVVVARDVHRHLWAQDLIEGLIRRHPSVTVVEMGWPAWRPAGARAYVATYGAGRANAQAAAERLCPA